MVSIAAGRTPASAVRPDCSEENALPERLPADSCDAHLHVFGDPKVYPVVNPHALYAPPAHCTFEAVQRLHTAMGIERAVLVQPTIYGTDHRLLHDVLAAAPKGRYRGVAIVDDSVSDAELQRLHNAGVRGARFNFSGNFKLAPDLATFRRTLARVRELGWYAKMFGFGDDLLVVEDDLRKIAAPAMIDHMGGLDYSRGASQPVVRLILDLLAKESWWIGLSNGDLRSHTGARGMMRSSSAGCSTEPLRTAVSGEPTGRMCIASSGRTRTAILTTASRTSSSASSCCSAICRIARRATACLSPMPRDCLDLANRQADGSRAISSPARVTPTSPDVLRRMTLAVPAYSGEPE
jgi:predicted TIM-barrel fold metal-dependent hydrolase